MNSISQLGCAEVHCVADNTSDIHQEHCSEEDKEETSAEPPSATVSV